jgi:hypothetical protein
MVRSGGDVELLKSSITVVLEGIAGRKAIGVAFLVKDLATDVNMINKRRDCSGFIDMFYS